MSLSNFIPDDIIIAISGTILHSLWQGVLISILLAVALLFVNKQSAKLRSALACVAMILFLVSSISTFTHLYNNSANETEKISALATETTVSENLSHTENDLISYSRVSAVSLYKSASQFVNNFYTEKFNYIFTFWVFGMLFLAFRMLGGFYYTQRIKHRRTIPIAVHWQQRVIRIAESLGVSKTIKLFESPFIKQPVVIGYFKPFILMPIGMITGLPQDQLEAIIAHEIAHIKRADYLLNLFQSVMEGLFFFNPAIWWFSSIIRKEREFSCDDLAIKHCGSRGALSHALLSIEELRGKSPAFSMGLIGNEKSLLGRIRRMNDDKNRNIDNQRKLFAAIMLITLFTTVILFSGASLGVEDGNADLIQPNVHLASFGSASEVPENAELVLEQSNSSSEKESNTMIEEHDSTDAHKQNGHAKAEYDIQVDLSALEDLHIEFDHQQLEESMAHLKEQLGHLKDIKFDFDFDGLQHSWPMDPADSAEFHKDMKMMKEELASLKDLKIDIKFDKEEFKESMREFKEEMKKHKKEMTNLGVEMKDLKKEMKILGAFITDVKKELVSDGHIDSVDDEVNLLLNREKMVVNDITVSELQHEKYLKLYKKHYGKELENEVNIHKH